MFGFGSILGLIGKKFNLQEIIKKLISGGMSEEEAQKEALSQRKEHRLNKAGGLIDAIGEGFGNTFSTIQSIIAPRKQMNMQKELMQEQAKLNYEYGERAAQNAYEREQAMYQQSKQDNSFAARKADAMGAGLSPGVLYGSTGASGGGAGSTGGGKMGATGTSGGAAPDPTAGIQTLLGLRQMKLQERKNVAEVKLMESQAKAAEAEAGNKEAQTKTENTIRALRKAITWLEGKDMYRNEILKRIWDNGSAFLKEDDTYKINNWGDKEVGEIFGNEEFNLNDYTMNMKELELQNALEVVNKISTEIEKIKSERDLNDAKKWATFQELIVAQQDADTRRIEALAKKLATMWETGEYTNWKTWVGVGKDAADVLTRLVGTIVGTKNAGRALKTLLEKTTRNPRPQTGE